MKVLKIKRFLSDDDATLSQIYYDDQFQCFGLEDEYRADKVVHQTRVPAGAYNIKLKKHGGFHERYAGRYAIHEGMLHLQNVPNFTDILIHIGNTDADTSGCILVGTGCVTGLDSMSVTSSRIAYLKLYEKVVSQVRNNNMMVIIEDQDGRT